jgi:methylated-DNA-protein-cysteine methyltransferase-like protein
MQEFTRRVIEAIRAIPPGRVSTYGQIAACAGSPRAARQVVRILHAMSGKYDLPWHRVINSKGEIGLRDPYGRELQISSLEDEGVVVKPGGRIELEEYVHQLDRWEEES